MNLRTKRHTRLGEFRSCEHASEHYTARWLYGALLANEHVTFCQDNTSRQLTKKSLIGHWWRLWELCDLVQAVAIVVTLIFC
jgi:hypothetical protein